MQIGMIGLGRMGANMRRLVKGGHKCVVYDRSPEAVKEVSAAGAVGTASLAALARNLAKPRAIWLEMVTPVLPYEPGAWGPAKSEQIAAGHSPWHDPSPEDRQYD